MSSRPNPQVHRQLLKHAGTKIRASSIAGLMPSNSTISAQNKRATRRPRTDSAVTQAAILDAAERLIVEEGYASVTSRRVAERSGLKPPLVHYHFKTTEALLIALYRRGAEQSLQRHASALAQDDPLTAIWRVNAEGSRTALALEFMAMANHRKFIREEIARYAEQIRAIQVATLERYLRERRLQPQPPFGPMALSVILAAISRSLVMEAGVGIHLGHQETEAAVAELLRCYCMPAATTEEGRT